MLLLQLRAQRVRVYNIEAKLHAIAVALNVPSMPPDPLPASVPPTPRVLTHRVSANRTSTGGPAPQMFATGPAAYGDSVRRMSGTLESMNAAAVAAAAGAAAAGSGAADSAGRLIGPGSQHGILPGGRRSTATAAAVPGRGMFSQKTVDEVIMERAERGAPDGGGGTASAGSSAPSVKRRVSGDRRRLGGSAPPTHRTSTASITHAQVVSEAELLDVLPS